MADRLLDAVEALRSALPPEHSPDNARLLASNRRVQVLVALTALADAVDAEAAGGARAELHPVQLEVIFRQVAHALAVLDVWGPSGTSEETLDAALRCLDTLLGLGVAGLSGAAVLLCAPFDTRRSEQALPVIVLINKMDRKDAAPFPDLVVPAPAPALHAARRVQRSLTHSAMQQLCAYRWPGNVRELQHVIARAVLLAESEHIEDVMLPRNDSATPDASETTTTNAAPAATAVPIEPAKPAAWPAITLAEAERRTILAALEHCNGDKSATARLLDISRTALYEKIKRYDIGK
jgi:hypothetical protein